MKNEQFLQIGIRAFRVRLLTCPRDKSIDAKSLGDDLPQKSCSVSPTHNRRLSSVLLSENASQPFSLFSPV